MLRIFLPKLVQTVGECVKSIADQCFSKGLITESKHDEVLHTEKVEKEKARILILAVKTAVQTNPECYKLFIHALETELPPVTKKVLLPEMSGKLSEMHQVDDTACSAKAVVPYSHQNATQHAGSLIKAITEQSQNLCGKLEEAIQEFERARTSRNQLEKDVKSKTHELKNYGKNLNNRKLKVILKERKQKAES